MMQETSELWNLPRLRSSSQRVSLPYISNLLVFAIFQWMVSWKPSESTVNLCNMWKYRKLPVLITGILYLKILSGSPKKLPDKKIFISRLGMWTVLQSWIIRLDKGIDYYTRGYVFNGHEKIAWGCTFCPDEGNPVQVGGYISHMSTIVKTCNCLRSRFIKFKGCFPLQITLQVQAEGHFKKNSCWV